MAINKKTREAVYRKYGGRCAYCGRAIAYKDIFSGAPAKLKLESKDALKKRGLTSPDRADAVALALYEGGIFDIRNLIA